MPGDGANGAREIEIEIERIRARLAANEFERKDLQTRLDELLSRRSTTSLEICKETIVGDALMVSAASPDSRSSRPMLSLSIWLCIPKIRFEHSDDEARPAMIATRDSRTATPRVRLESPCRATGECGRYYSNAHSTAGSGGGAPRRRRCSDQGTPGGTSR